MLNPTLREYCKRHELIRKTWIGKKVKLFFNLPIYVEGTVVEVRAQSLYVATKKGQMLIQNNSIISAEVK